MKRFSQYLVYLAALVFMKIMERNKSSYWYLLYDKKEPPYWSFEKGMFIEKFDENYHVEAFISADTAYYFETKKLWELRGRVFVKNIKGETFKTSLLYWDQA